MKNLVSPPMKNFGDPPMKNFGEPPQTLVGNYSVLYCQNYLYKAVLIIDLLILNYFLLYYLYMGNVADSDE